MVKKNLEGHKRKRIEKLSKSKASYTESREDGFVKKYKTEM